MLPPYRGQLTNTPTGATQVRLAAVVAQIRSCHVQRETRISSLKRRANSRMAGMQVTARTSAQASCTGSTDVVRTLALLAATLQSVPGSGGRSGGVRNMAATWATSTPTVPTLATITVTVAAQGRGSRTAGRVGLVSKRAPGIVIVSASGALLSRHRTGLAASCGELKERKGSSGAAVAAGDAYRCVRLDVCGPESSLFCSAHFFFMRGCTRGYVRLPLGNA